MEGDRKTRFTAFAEWVRGHITGDEKGQSQIFLDRIFQAFGHRGVLEVGGTPEFRIRKAQEDGGGTSFADLVWKPHVLIEMKKRGEDGWMHRATCNSWSPPAVAPCECRLRIVASNSFDASDMTAHNDARVD